VVQTAAKMAVPLASGKLDTWATWKQSLVEQQGVSFNNTQISI